MTFGIPPREFAVPTPSASRHRDLLRTRRTIPRWPLLLLLIGTLAAGPVGLVVASLVAGALVVLRLRLIAADPEVSELPALPWTRRTGVPVLPGFTRTVGSVEWGLVSAFDFDTALRPRLTRVAAARLARNCSVAREQKHCRPRWRQRWRVYWPVRALAQSQRS